MTKWYCDECVQEHSEKPTICSKCGCQTFNEYMEVTDYATLKIQICDLIKLITEVADGTEQGDDLSQILADATSQEVRDFIAETLEGCKC